MKKITYQILTFVLLLITALVIFGLITFTVAFMNSDRTAKYLRDNPIKNDSTFVLEVSYVNSLKEVETFVVPSDSKFYVTTINGTYHLNYKYNIGVECSGYSEKHLKSGVVNFKIINNEK